MQNYFKKFPKYFTTILLGHSFAFRSPSDDGKLSVDHLPDPEVVLTGIP
jgi:hypothetical protein